MTHLSVHSGLSCLLDCVQTFFAQRVLGQDRAVLLRHQMTKQGTHERQDHRKRIAAVEKAIAELGRRQDNLMDEREAKTIDDNDGGYRHRPEQRKYRPRRAGSATTAGRLVLEDAYQV